MSATLKANVVSLSKTAEFWFWGEGGNDVAVPMGRYAVKDLAEALDALGADRVVFDYRTTSDPKHRDSDRKRFAKRLASLGPDWSVGEWSNKVVRGFVFPNDFACVVERVAVEV